MVQGALDGGELLVQKVVEFAQRIVFSAQAIDEFLQLFLPCWSGAQQSQAAQSEYCDGYKPVFHLLYQAPKLPNSFDA